VASIVSVEKNASASGAPEEGELLWHDVERQRVYAILTLDNVSCIIV